MWSKGKWTFGEHKIVQKASSMDTIVQSLKVLSLTVYHKALQLQRQLASRPFGLPGILLSITVDMLRWDRRESVLIVFFVSSL